jgi:acyl-CoA dehydrogenase
VVGVSAVLAAKSLNLYANDDVKNELPQVAAVDIRVAVSVAEPDGGTDVLGGMKTRATKGDGGWQIMSPNIWSSPHLSPGNS